jgi:hypothetical protein
MADKINFGYLIKEGKKLWSSPRSKYVIITLALGLILAGITGTIIIKELSKAKLPVSKPKIKVTEEKPKITAETLQIIKISDPGKVESVLNKIRRAKKLSCLNLSESGKKISGTKSGTYFYLLSYDLAKCNFFSDTTFIEQFKKLTQSRNRTRPYSFFEVHYTPENELYLIGFISPISAWKIAKGKSGSEKSISVLPYPWNGLNNLIILPLKRITNLSIRTIVVNEGAIDEIDVIEMSVK